MSVDPELEAMANKQRRLATIMWVISVSVLVGSFVVYVTGVRSILLIAAGIALSGGFAGLARGAQRRAHFAQDGESTDDLDLDF